MSNKNEEIKIESKGLRGTLKESLKNPITGAVSDDDHFLIKFHGIYQQDDRDRREERAQKKLEPLYTFMLRLRIPGGKISSSQWLGIHEIADKYSTGIIKITTRETIQLHGIIKSHLKPTIQDFNKFNLDSISTCGDVNRNLMISTTAPKNKAYDEIYQIGQEISQNLLPKTRAYHEIWLDGEKLHLEDEKSDVKDEQDNLYQNIYLPRKFKIAIAIPPENDVDVYANDIGLIAVIENEELVGFNVSIGGGLGTTHGNANTYPRLGSLIGFVEKKNIQRAIYEILTTQRDYGNREDRKLSRLKYTVDRYGVEWFISELEKRQGFKYQSLKQFKFETRNDDYGWCKDYKNKWHFTLFVENGRVLDEENYKLKSAILEIAQNNYANFCFSANQNIIFTDVEEINKAKIDEILKRNNVNNDYSLLRKSSMACVALNTCPLAMAEGQRYLPTLITKIESIIEKYNLQNEEITIRMTGCPNGCARPYMAEIGLIGKSYGIYNLYFGGSAVGERLNRIYKESLDEKQILSELDDIFSKFSKDRKLDESFGDFSNRILFKD